MVYLYHLKFKVVSPSEDALIVNNYVLMATVNIMKFLPNQYLKCNYSGINSVKLFTRNQYLVSNPIQVSIDIVEIWYRTGTD